MIQINPTEIPALRENDRISGKPSTAVVLMKYGDYQCSKSGKAHAAIEKLQQELGERFCFVFRHFPQPKINPQSMKAAETAEAAGSQGKFWEMHSTLFENQDALEDCNLIEHAVNLELNISLVLKELSERTHRDRIQQDIDSGIEHQVEKTPTFFISIRHEGTQNLEQMLMGILRSITEQ